MPLHHAQMAGQDADPLPLHRRGEDRLPAAFFAEQVAAGTSQSDSDTSAIGEVRRPILWSFLPTIRPGCSFLDQKCRNAVRACGRIDVGEHDRDVGVNRVGDESLGAVQDVFVALALGARLQAVGIGARSRLGHACSPIHRR